MKDRIIVDTGPLVAFLRRNEQYHQWSRETFAAYKPPFYTSEPVLAEACFLIERGGGHADDLLEMLDRGLIVIGINIQDYVKAIRKQIVKYHNMPMSLADASLVLLSELQDRSLVLTLDSDFRIYRRFGRKTIPVMMPNEL